MKRKLLALITAAVTAMAMMPAAAFAADNGLLNGIPEEDVCLSKAITRDSSGQIVFEEDYNPNGDPILSRYPTASEEEGAYVTTYRYDDRGNLIQEKNTYSDGSSLTLTHTYDSEDRMISTKSVGSSGFTSIERYTYDTNGNMIREEYQDDENYSYTEDNHYDANGRLTTSSCMENLNGHVNYWNTVKSYQDYSDLSWDVTTTYQYPGDEEPFSYTESWNYDRDGNLLSSVEMEEGDLYRTENTYNSDGQMTRTKVTIVGSTEASADKYEFITTYSYNSEGLLVQSDDNYGNTTSYIYTLKMFGDVPYDAYFAQSVKWAVEEGITQGMAAATESSNAAFCPEAFCTRAQAVTFLWRAAGQPEPKSSANPFTDVQSSDYFYKAVLWAVEQNITVGMSANTFEPNTACSRGQIVTFLHRYQGKPDVEGSNPFLDVQGSDFFYNAVLWANATGVTKGTSAELFSPKALCTRGQIVTFLFRTMHAN